MAPRKTASVFLSCDEEPAHGALDACLGVDDDGDELRGNEYDNYSDTEEPGAVASRASRAHVVECARPLFRPLPDPGCDDAATVAADEGEDATRPIERSRDVDGVSRSVVDYAAWLATQAYSDDLKFINADFIEFAVGGHTILLEQARGLGKGGHLWDGAYVLLELSLIHISEPTRPY